MTVFLPVDYGFMNHLESEFRNKEVNFEALKLRCGRHRSRTMEQREVKHYIDPLRPLLLKRLQNTAVIFKNPVSLKKPQ